MAGGSSDRRRGAFPVLGFLDRRESQNGNRDVASIDGSVLLLRDGERINPFVETGTYRGDTAPWASEHFAEVVTIERSLDLYEASRARFAGQSGVECVLADSRGGLVRSVPTCQSQRSSCSTPIGRGA